MIKYKEVSPCINCKSSNIDIYSIGCGTAYYGGGRCKDCNNKSVDVVGVNSSKEKLTKIWNNENNIIDIIIRKRKLINKTQKEIDSLTLLL
jgi:hypothetical protein